MSFRDEINNEIKALKKCNKEKNGIDETRGIFAQFMQQIGKKIKSTHGDSSNKENHLSSAPS